MIMKHLLRNGVNLLIIINVFLYQKIKLLVFSWIYHSLLDLVFNYYFILLIFLYIKDYQNN